VVIFARRPISEAVSVSSGQEALDQLALATIKAAAPFPPALAGLPPDQDPPTFQLDFYYEDGRTRPLVLLSESVRETFVRSVRRAVAVKWQPPPLQSWLQPATVLRIHPQPAGTIGQVELVRSSGDAALDESWQRAVRAAAPFRATAPAWAPIFAEGIELELQPAISSASR
jgi:TonB family protein